MTASPNFNQLQSAYRPLHSTETSLPFTLNNVYRASDSGKPTALIAQDLSAAFDTIDHGILLNRLNISFGVSCPVWLWLQSYLSDRSHAAGQHCRAVITAHEMHSRGATGLGVRPTFVFFVYRTCWSPHIDAGYHASAVCG